VKRKGGRTYLAQIGDVGNKPEDLSMVPPGIRNLYMISDTVSDAEGLGIQGVACASQKLVDRLL